MATSSSSSPSTTDPPARAWLEYERGRGPAGTKVLLVEWEESAATARAAGTWTVSWNGKPKHDPSLLAESEWASDHRAGSPTSGSGASPAASPSTTAGEDGADSHTEGRAGAHRVYFYLTARRSVPTTITLSLHPPATGAPPTPEPVVTWEVRPQPARAPQPGDEEEDEDGGKGALHTRWAARRLASLAREIADEARRNCEGVALQMALGEREFIERNFGVGAASPAASPARKKKGRAAAAAAAAGGLAVRPAGAGEVPVGPHSPLSPGGGRLGERLRGLKLQTRGQGEDEVAVPLCKGQRERLAAAAAAAAAASAPVASSSSAAAAASTPAAAGMSSIGAVLASQPNRAADKEQEEEDDEEDGVDKLFALPLSPRSPEMTKSPFSFAAEDTKRYLSTRVA
jgi:hypothetical protein